MIAHRAHVILLAQSRNLCREGLVACAFLQLRENIQQIEQVFVFNLAGTLSKKLFKSINNIVCVFHPITSSLLASHRAVLVLRLNPYSSQFLGEQATLRNGMRVNHSF